MPAPVKLNDAEIREKLAQLSGWSLESGMIQKKYAFKDFRESVGFILKVSFLAEQADHHPDIDVRYNKVTLKLATHSAGGLTEKDFALAREIDA